MTSPNLPERELWAAVGRGDPARVREFVSAGADPNTIASAGGDTPLIRAIASGNSAVVTALIEAGANVNLPSRQPRFWTPLMYAHDKPEILSALIAAGADLQARTTSDWIRAASGRLIQRPGGETALHLAAGAGKADPVRILLRAGAKLEAVAENGHTPLDYALRLGSVTEAAEALVEAGAELTPARLELMHASAHSPDSDLITFPFASETDREFPVAANSGAHGSGAQPSPPAPFRPVPNQSTEFRCPNCHALIYSRKAMMCGQCGAPLPSDLRLTDAQAQALDDQRSWARELADKFDPDYFPPGAAASIRSRPPTLDPQGLLRRVSCASEFRHRERPAFWLHAVGYALFFFTVFVVPWKMGIFPATIAWFMAAGFALLCLRAWIYASPICPNCNQNITLCPANYCHICGEPLKNGRCNTCGVDNSWTGFLNPYAGLGNYRWMTFCPDCGAHLDSKIPRRRCNT